MRWPGRRRAASLGGMTKALYDLIGANRDADRDALRTAYTRTVASLVRRRKALVEQGGDTRKLDLLRAQADEAWELLSDPARRRRYDALLALSDAGELPRGETLWTQVVGSLASPAAAAGVDVVRALSHLQVGQLPGPASRVPDAPTAVDPDRAAPPDTQADIPTQAAEPRGRDMPELQVMPGSGIRGPASGRDASQGSPASPVSAQPPKVVPFQVTPSLRPGSDRAQVGPGSDQPSSSPQSTPPAAPRRPDADADVVHLRSDTPAPPPPAARTPGSSSASSRPGANVDALVAEHGWSGTLLRSVREAQGMSLRDIGSATRISARYLEAIEADDHDHLPSATFVKGYLREIARTLGLDEAALVQGYMRRMS